MNTFETLQSIIQLRRSTKPSDMNGRIIPRETVERLLQLADWAPTHGKTEPWRFIVFEGKAKQAFCLEHAELYKANTAPDKFQEAKYDKLLHQGDLVSHTILVYMKRSQGNTIPVLEEIAAVAAAIQNLLLGAAAQGISALWGTGGMTHHPALKKHFHLDKDDVVMGILHLGYSDNASKEGTRGIPMEEKVIWRES